MKCEINGDLWRNEEGWMDGGSGVEKKREGGRAGERKEGRRNRLKDKLTKTYQY